MTRGKTSRWVQRQRRDRYAQDARRDGFRARAVYKLAQIDSKYHLLKPKSLIVDLGAAPGSWSQYAAQRVRAGGRVVAVDKLDMRAVDAVQFIRGDFTDPAVSARVVAALDGRHADLVLSDLAPNLSGMASIDQANMETLQDAVLAFCQTALAPGGVLLTKLFAGESVAAVRRRLAMCFDDARSLKPDASRSESKETYLLARGHKYPKHPQHPTAAPGMPYTELVGADSDSNSDWRAESSDTMDASGVTHPRLPLLRAGSC